MSKADLDAMQNEGFYEINICAEHLARPFEQHEFFRFRGMTFALYQAGLISKEYRKMMNGQFERSAQEREKRKGPVSYTHLDVYKRQGVHRGK